MTARHHEAGAEPDNMSPLAAQRRRARRTALLLGFLALCLYLGFIVSTGLR